MKKFKKFLAVVMSTVMMLGAASQVNYEAKAATQITRMTTTPVVIGQEYTVKHDVDMEFEYEGFIYTYNEFMDMYNKQPGTVTAKADVVFKVTVPAFSGVDLNFPTDVQKSVYNFYSDGKYIEHLGDYLNNPNASAVVYIIAVDAISTDFSFTPTQVKYTPDFDGQICVYSWNDELISRVDHFYEKYPQYKDYVKCVNLEMSSLSEEYFYALKKLSDQSDSTSILAITESQLNTYIESGYYEPLSSVGFDVGSYMNTAYDYTEVRGSYNGEIYAATWQVCPNNFIYDVDIANQVLGTSDPEQVQAKINTPEKFLEVAAQMKAAGYTMCNDLDGIYTFTTKANVAQPAGTVDEEVKAFYDQLVANGYTVGAPAWSTEWYEAMEDKNVFGYFGCSWYTYWSHEYSDAKNVKTCRGPVDYAWGGTYIMANNKNKGNDIAKLLLETLCCDTEVMKNILTEDEDVVNNELAMQQLISEGKGNFDNFGGQNVYAVWDEAAKEICSYAVAQGVYVSKMDRTGVTAGLVVSGNKLNSEFSWWACEGNSGEWFLVQDWTLGNEWLNWTPDKFGDYIIVGKTRQAGNPNTETAANINITYHPQIKGMCQMPYTGEGGGYLIGVESYENPNQEYQYEMLVLDCTLLAEGKDAWVYTTGKFTVAEGNAGWTIWQPQYGYYWTLFRVYDASGNLLDEYCYGFVNAY